MGFDGKKLRVSGSGPRVTYWFFCPGCRCRHPFTVTSDGSPSWSFDGNMESPTFSPSLRVLGNGDSTLCHLFLVAGRLQFCSDSPHELAGKTVDLPDLD